MAATDGTGKRTIEFTGVDALMRSLDEPARPQTIELEVAVAEPLDDQRIADAVEVAAHRHPMARASQAAAGPFDLNYRWTLGGTLDGRTVTTVASSSSEETDRLRDRFLSAHVPLDAPPPFRLMHVHEPGCDRILMSVNHAAFDGIGALRLLQSMSRAYNDEVDPLPDIDPMDARRYLDRPPDDKQQRPGRVTMPSRPARLKTSPTEGTAGFGVTHLDLALADASRTGTTVNDVLVAALHWAVHHWNIERGEAADEITTMLPINQRPPEWRGEVLANLVLAGQIRSTPSDRATPGALLRAVTQQTTDIKTNGVGGISALARTSRIPVVVRRALSTAVDAIAPWTADTAILSNLGRTPNPPAFGSACLGIWFGPPPRMPVPLTIGAASAEDRLGISVRWCQPALTRTAGEEFAHRYLDAIAAIRSDAAG